MTLRRPDPTFWRGKRVLLTGHTGFKGTWMLLWLQTMGANVKGLALVPETEPSLFRLVADHEPENADVVDLRNASSVRGRVDAVRPDIVIHMGAQAIVRTSISDPLQTLATNVMGTAHLLDALRNHPECLCILTVTSDKVYANEDLGRQFRESDSLGGKDPYSASKAAAEIVVASFATTYFASGAVVATARGGNVIGGGDYARNRIVPDIVRAFSAGEDVVLRHPNSTRPWQHVLDCVAGYLCYVETLLSGSNIPRQMNFGPRDAGELTVAAIAERGTAAMRKSGGSPGWRHEPVEGSVEAKFLAVDATLAAEKLGFSCLFDKPTALDWTMDWYSRYAEGADPRDLTLKQIADYEAIR